MATHKTSTPHYELHIALDHSEPSIWRRVSVPRDITLAELHAVIQIAMGWDDDHLHQFMIGRKRYAPFSQGSSGIGTASGNESIVHLNGVAKPRKKFSYEYDFGDGWTHTITVEREAAAPADAVAAGTHRQVRCLAGANACPPEDCGGIGGYMNLLDARSDPAHPEHAHALDWLDEDFDPEAFDLTDCNTRLAHLQV